MKITDLTVEVRDSSLARVGQILPSDLVGLQLALRFNKVGAWKISLRSDHPLADALRAPGAGLIVTGPTGVILSGPTTSATSTKTADDPTGQWQITGVDDSVILGERLAYPTPTTADLTLQTSAYDTRTGAAESVVKAYVNANIGPSAPAARKISALTIDTDLGRGSTVTGNARFDMLGSLIESLMLTSGLGFDITQSGSNLTFNVFAPTDRSAEIRMDVDNLRLTKSEYSYTAPQATRVIVAGQGQGSARTFIERFSSSSTDAETSWGRRIEVFKDSRDTSVTAELQQAGDEILIDKGKTVVGISVSPSDDQTMRYGTDWGLGDKVSVVVGSSQISQIVTEVAIVVTEEGIKVGATVGDPAVAAAATGDTETSVIETQSDQEDRISNLERNEPASGGGSDIPGDDSVSTVKIQDGAVTNAKLADGIASSRITGLDTTLSDKVGITATGLGKTGSPALVALASAQDWSDLPVGFSAMLTNSSTGLPETGYGYFTKIAQRNTNYGWGGIWVNYSTGATYTGSAASNSVYATWKRLDQSTLPEPATATSSSTGNNVTATAWGTAAPNGQGTVSLVLAKDAWVEVSFGGWLLVTGTSGDIRVGVAISGATTVAAATTNDYPHWGNVLYKNYLSGGTNGGSASYVVKCNAGTSTFTLQAYKTGSPTLAAVNYSSITVTPLRWA